MPIIVWGQALLLTPNSHPQHAQAHRPTSPTRHKPTGPPARTCTTHKCTSAHAQESTCNHANTSTHSRMHARQVWETGNKRIRKKAHLHQPLLSHNHNRQRSSDHQQHQHQSHGKSKTPMSDSCRKWKRCAPHIPSLLSCCCSCRCS